jgi:CBS domain containing-hemolysin-like protein
VDDSGWNTVANFIILGWLIAILHEALRQHVWQFVGVFSVTVFLFYPFSICCPKCVPQFSEPALPLACAALRHHPFRLAPLVALVERFSSLLCAGAAARRSPDICLVFGGVAVGDAGIGPGFTSEERAMTPCARFASLTVRQAMKPFAHATMVTVDTPVRDLLAMGREKQTVRLPIWELVTIGSESQAWLI